MSIKILLARTLIGRVTQKEMEDYCVQDVKVTKYLFDHLMELAEMQGHGDTHAPLKEWVSKNKKHCT